MMGIYKFDNTLLLKNKIKDSSLDKIKLQEQLYLTDINSILSSCFSNNDIEIDILKKLYEYEFVSKRCGGHYDKIINSINECPYCGFGEVTEIDHFLFKSSYPEFMLFYYNFIHSCHNCNKQKGIKTIHIHPYINKIDVEPFKVKQKY